MCAYVYYEGFYKIFWFSHFQTWKKKVVRGTKIGKSCLPTLSGFPNSYILHPHAKQQKKLLQYKPNNYRNWVDLMRLQSCIYACSDNLPACLSHCTTTKNHLTVHGKLRQYYMYQDKVFSIVLNMAVDSSWQCMTNYDKKDTTI